MYRLTTLLLLSFVAACGGSNDRPAGDAAGAGDGPGGDAPDFASEATADGAAGGDGRDAGSKLDGGARDLGAVDLGPQCAKHLTVVFAVGAGAGSAAALSNGCWTVVDADGAANKQFRKCSTSNFMVQNASAPNYAYDDTNPDRPLSDDQDFLSQCASGASGEGFEYMAYRSGAWRLLTASRLKAWFAELYSSDTTVDDFLADWPKTLSGHTVSPMINIGPNQPQTIQSGAASMCKPLGNGGYFGVYNGDWRNPMPTSDARVKALAAALNACTR